MRSGDGGGGRGANGGVRLSMMEYLGEGAAKMVFRENYIVGEKKLLPRERKF